MNRLLMLLLLALLGGALEGCSSGIPVRVDAIAETTAPAGEIRYVLVNGNAGETEDDLFFREFWSYFAPILAEKGYRRVADARQADVRIRFRYAVSEGHTGISTFTHPVYALTGGETINITETKTDASGKTTTTRSTVEVPVRERYVGTRVERRRYTLFTSSAVLEARRMRPPKGRKPRMLWKTLISSTSESNDLRAIMPVMAAAARPYLTGNSGARKKRWLKLDAPEVNAVREAARQGIRE